MLSLHCVDVHYSQHVYKSLARVKLPLSRHLFVCLVFYGCFDFDSDSRDLATLSCRVCMMHSLIRLVFDIVFSVEVHFAPLVLLRTTDFHKKSWGNRRLNFAFSIFQSDW